MPNYRVSVEVDRPIEDAWEVLMDESKMGEWLEGYKGMELLEGEPLTVGSKHKMIFEEDGREMTFIETVTAIEPPTEFSFDFDHDMMTSNIQMTLESTGHLSTRIMNRTKFKAKGFFINLFMYFMTPRMTSRQRRSFASLKALIEES
jgi:carbon monoxide dehydrogenase subunit G